MLGYILLVSAFCTGAPLQGKHLSLCDGQLQIIFTTSFNVRVGGKEKADSIRLYVDEDGDFWDDRNEPMDPEKFKNVSMTNPGGIRRYQIIFRDPRRNVLKGMMRVCFMLWHIGLKRKTLIYFDMIPRKN